ncbi:hypothetical protein [Streptomyces sp. 8N616]|uniref:hypothetical protein n=1 Tax=Streptomyces sp. 8N616 TaxID=3457414 RepID=UPI003FD5FFB4
MRSRIAFLVLIALRLAGAGLTAAMAAIHVYLWDEGYRNVATIGELFLVNGVVGGLLAVVLLVAGVRRLGIVAALGALFTAGTLGALVLSLTSGLFGFTESIDAPWVTTTIAVESAGTVVLAAIPPVTHLAVRADARHGGSAPRATPRAPGHGERPSAGRQ